jgi:hypothetical protein
MTSFCESINSYYGEGNCSIANPPAACSLPGYLSFKERLFKSKINPFQSQLKKEHVMYTYSLLENNLKNGGINYSGSWTSAMFCNLPDGKTIYDLGYKPDPAINFLNGELVKISTDFRKIVQYVPPVIQMFISADLFIVLLFIIIILTALNYFYDINIFSFHKKIFKK